MPLIAQKGESGASFDAYRGIANWLYRAHVDEYG